MPQLSVIIPTHKRPQILRRCLEHIEKQTVADRLEVIVVSDGPDPETAQLFRETKNYQLKTINYIEIPKSQQGVARNRGVALATASLCLFIGDDIFLAPDACERHMRAHEKIVCHPEPVEGSTHSPVSMVRRAHHDTGVAVLGHTTWDPSLDITPVMRWLERTGWQFGYPKISRYAQSFIPEHLQHRFTYTSHVSLPTEIAKCIPFREDVSLYGWEDIEWGMRLRAGGLRLFYEPSAKAYHHHRITLEESLKRMETLGKSAVHFEKLVPELSIVPKGLKFQAYRLFSLLPTMRGLHAKAFLRGISSLR